MQRAAIVAVAANEWRRHARSMLMLGVIGGLFGGTVVAGAALTRRTDTAPGRLMRSANLGDVHIRLFGTDQLADEIVALPQVRRGLSAGVAIGRIEGFGAVQYAGVVAPTTVSELLTPVVVSGRVASDDAADEVMVTEQIAGRVGLAVGDRLQLSMLTPEEVGQFDTGFSDPDGPSLDLTIAGVVRVPPGVFDGTPIIATPAFAASYHESFAGFDLFVEVPAASRAGLEAAIDDLVAASLPEAATADDFTPVAIDDPRAGTQNLIDSSRVQLGGLLTVIAAAAVAVMVALTQAWSRQHSASAADQQVERALGMTTAQRVAARTLPAAAIGVLAGLLAAAVGTAGGVLEPSGALRRVEPDPGWRPDVAIVVWGTLLVTGVVVATAAVTAWLAGRVPGERIGSPRAHASALLPRRNGWPLAGTLFALTSAGAARKATMRLSLVAATLGVGGVVAAGTFDASLDRLVSTPERYGWQGDLVVVDVNDDVVDDLVRDQRFEAVADISSGTLSVAGRFVTGYSMQSRRGDISWQVLAGRLPTAADEMMAGSTLADGLDLDVGDVVIVGDAGPTGPETSPETRAAAGGSRVAMTVVGLGIGPSFGGEELGDAALFTPAGLDAASAIGNFREGMVRLADGVDVTAVADDLGGRYELQVRELPDEIRNVADLGSLPTIFGAFLAALATVALAHTLIVTVRERADDLAVLRTLGATPRQAALTVVTMSVATAVVGIVVGVPLGWGLARLVWSSLASSIGVADDVVVPISILVVVGAAIVLAVAVAAVPARRVARADPRHALRAE